MSRALISTMEDLANETDIIGILPFFKSAVPGWSLEEMIDPAVWFTDIPGPWEWKGPLAYEKRLVYGKFIGGKAAFVSLEWFRELASWRRGAFWDHADRAEAGEAGRNERLLMRYVTLHPGELSRNARRECGFTKGYDAALTKLEMQTYIIDQDFRYSIDRHGAPYGWGNAALIRPEDWIGLSPDDATEPEDSLESIVQHLKTTLPSADERLIRRALR